MLPEEIKESRGVLPTYFLISLPLLTSSNVKGFKILLLATYLKEAPAKAITTDSLAKSTKEKPVVGVLCKRAEMVATGVLLTITKGVALGVAVVRGVALGVGVTLAAL